MQFKEIVYNGFPILVSDTGIIMTTDRDVTYSDGRVYHYQSRIIPTYKDKRGYEVACLSDHRRKVNIKVHRAVAMAYIDNPFELPQVNHKDEDKSNNNVSNLEWCDDGYNVNYGCRNEKAGDILGKKVLCVDTGEVYRSYNHARQVMGHPKSTCIRDCCNGRQKTAYGYRWKWL